MNCSQSEQYVLLEQSGELSPRKTAALKRHLAACERCAEYRAHLVWVTRESQGAPPDQDVSHETIRTILAEGKRSAPQPTRPRVIHEQPRPSFLNLWQPALTYAAAALVVALVGWYSLRFWARDPQQAAHPPEPPTEQVAWDNGIDREIEELNTMLVMTVEDWQESDVYISDSELEDIAQELLELEGTSI